MREEIIELTGDDPVDVLGQDWENEVQELNEKDSALYDDAGYIGGANV